ncbi:hypothetical protein QAD02_006330 [Eretmocerus hayati]|uniref:Uncharacterized protein n=1 Tax=Eretmocerus hayati TaxID=131215 RepID=A0ACC2N1M7_9HYME|nr:hypothetical protein QAD02_006330 [Eretmocerus hayati]
MDDFDIDRDPYEKHAFMDENEKNDRWDLFIGVADIYRREAWTEFTKLNRTTLHNILSVVCNKRCKEAELLPYLLDSVIFDLPKRLNINLTEDENNKMLNSVKQCRINDSNIYNDETCLLVKAMETISLIERKSGEFMPLRRFTEELLKLGDKCIVKDKKITNSDLEKIIRYIPRAHCILPAIKSLQDYAKLNNITAEGAMPVLWEEVLEKAIVM